MTRLVSSIFALAFVASFGACEGHSVAALPPHYQHKLHHGAKEESHPAESPAERGEKEAKDPNRAHKANLPENPAAHPGENPAKRP